MFEAAATLEQNRKAAGKKQTLLGHEGNLRNALRFKGCRCDEGFG